MTMAPTDCENVRCSRTYDKSRCTSEEVMKTFCAATPARNSAADRTRTAAVLDREPKNTRNS